MALETVNPVKELMVIAPASKVGKLIKATEYEDFKEIIEKEENIADVIIDANKLISQKLQVGIDAKNIIDTVSKPMKDAMTTFRTHLIKYAEEKKIDKLEGKTKNITFQAEKTSKGVIAVPQIKIGAKYIDIKELSKDDVITELKRLGAKTRIRNEDVTAITKASLRMPK